MNKQEPTAADAPHNCPHCNTSLLDKEIPENVKNHYSGNYYKREIGIEIPEKYDGIYYYMCPDCNGTFGGYKDVIEKYFKVK
jgi:DNA-directed RNA polymerase subunit RPC12/RpoP